MEDRQIIQLYWQRDQRAIQETNQKYGAYCFTAARNILGSGQDAEECVNDAFLNAWNAIPPQSPDHLRMFLVKLTRRLAFNRWRDARAEKRGGGETALVLEELAECLPAGSGGPQEACEARELAECVRRFVRELPERERKVFLRRCFFTEPVSEIARRYGLTENNVSVILSRTRGRLRDYLAKEGY